MNAMARASRTASLCATALLLVQSFAAEADEVADAVAEAAVGVLADGQVDGDCIAGAVASTAVAEGVKKGRKLLGRLGINTAPAAPAASPCAGGGFVASEALKTLRCAGRGNRSA